jgi:hypothetical protein
VSSEALPEPCNGLLARGPYRTGRIDRNRRLSRRWPLQCVELAGQKARGHVVVGSSGQSAQQLLPGGIHQYKTNGRLDRFRQTRAIRSLQGGAGGDGDCVAGNPGADRMTKAIQPRPAIVIGQGDPGAHFLDGFGSMEVIAFEKGATYCGSERRTQCRLAAAGHAHHDNGQWAYGE